MAQQTKVKQLLDRKKRIESSLKDLMESNFGDTEIPTTDNPADQISSIAPEPEQAQEKIESLLTIPTGILILMEFQNVVIKLKRLYNDYFEVDDKGMSTELSNGDILKLVGNDVLKKGAIFKFVVYRKIDAEYVSNALASWREVKR